MARAGISSRDGLLSSRILLVVKFMPASFDLAGLEL
jgi:hypothetical protein